MKHIIQFIVLILCAVFVVGEVLEVVHVNYAYSSEVSLSDNTFHYSVSSDCSADFNIILTENPDRKAVNTVYIYLDSAWGCAFSDYESIVDPLQKRLADRGTESEIINTTGLGDLLSQPSAGVGIVIGTGTIPETLKDQLLYWVQSGGTLYWTLGIIGNYLSKPDGTYYTPATSMEPSFLGDCCTTLESANAVHKETVTGFSDLLELKNREMYGSLDVHRIPGRYLALGYTLDTFSEIVFVECGLGTVCVISGKHDMYQSNDLIQIICAGLTLDSKIAISINTSSNLYRNSEGSSAIMVNPSSEYVAYSFVSGLNPPFGKTVRFLP